MNDTTALNTDTVGMPADIPGFVTYTPADPRETVTIGDVVYPVLYFATLGDGKPSPVIDYKI